MKYVLTIVWILISPLWSTIINIKYWIINHKDLKKALEAKKELDSKLAVYKLSHAVRIMKKFKWRQDNYGDWVPWIITILNEEYTDDCDGAAKLAKYMLKKLGLHAKILHLRNFETNNGHAVCHLPKHNLLFSNSDVIRLSKDMDQFKAIKYAFNNRYTHIL